MASSVPEPRGSSQVQVRLMRAFGLQEFGTVGSLQELDVPEPAAGEVLVRLRAASLNAFDCSVVAGRAKDYMEHRFPLIPGLDGAGTIEALGADVSGFSVGDDIFGIAQKPFIGQGTLAEYGTFPTETIAAKPAAIEFGAAAALPTAGLTALSAIEALDPRDGQVVVVFGATGGVGSYAVQLAATSGAHVIAVTRNEYAEYARSLGAAEVIDYTAGDSVQQVRASFPEGIDGVLDFAGRPELVAAMADLVHSGGRVVSTIGAADHDELAKRGIEGINANRAGSERLTELAGLVENGRLRAPKLNVYPLDRAAAALAEQAERHVPGKIVIAIA